MSSIFQWGGAAALILSAIAPLAYAQDTNTHDDDHDDENERADTDIDQVCHGALERTRNMIMESDILRCYDRNRTINLIDRILRHRFLRYL